MKKDVRGTMKYEVPNGITLSYSCKVTSQEISGNTSCPLLNIDLLQSFTFILNRAGLWPVNFIYTYIFSSTCSESQCTFLVSYWSPFPYFADPLIEHHIQPTFNSLSLFHFFLRSSSF